MTGTKRKLCMSLGGAVALLGSADAASATVYYNDFATIGATDDYGQGPYSYGGVTIQYVGTGTIWTTSHPAAPSGYSWYPDGGGIGYDDITLTGGGTFTSIELLAGSGFFEGGADLLYQVLNGATVVGSGDLGALPGSTTGFATFDLSGGPFTELRVQGVIAPATFDPSNFEALAIGAITISTSTSTVPEPSTWAMMLLGFAGLGFAGYRRTRKALSIAA